jgi:hypothetical protein
MMKNLTLMLLVFCITAHINPCAAQSDVPYSASDLLEKAIKFHDPEGKWNNYSGKVKLNTSFPDGNTYGTEIFEIDVAKNFYCCTRLAGGMKIIKGIKEGKIFRSVNGNINLTPEEINKFGIGDTGIIMMKEWHYFHFGILAYFRSVGSDLQNKVTRSNFMGKDCYLLTFIGDSSKVTEPRWAGEVIFYIDAKTFAVNGIQWTSWGVYEMLEGSLDINGIKLSKVRNYYTKEDNTLQGVDFFTRADDNFHLPEGYRTSSYVTGSNIGLISTHLLKLENEETLKKLEEPLKEINNVLAEIGYPECGYLIYKVNADNKSDYTHVMEGWWMNQEVYELTHNDPKLKELYEKYRDLFENVLSGEAYFRMTKIMSMP